MKARRKSFCHYCDSGIRPGMVIERASFNIRSAGLRDYYDRPVTEWVHEQCARHARAEWPDLNAERV